MSVSTGGLLAFIAISMGILKPVTCIFTEKVISGDLGLLRGQDMFQALIREHFTMDTKHNPSLDQGCVMNYLGSVPSEEKQMPVQMVQTLRGRRDISMGILKPVTCIFTEKVISGDLGLLRGQDMFQALIREHFTMDTKHNPSLDQGCVMNYLGSVPSEEKQMPVQMVQTLRGRRDMPGSVAVGAGVEALGMRARRDYNKNKRKKKTRGHRGHGGHGESSSSD